MGDTIVIIGAGMSGMLAALLIKKRNPSTQVIVLEHSSQPGGNYKGVELEGFGFCDPAMRLIYETGIPELDQIIRDILPDTEWQVFSDNEKDIAGIYWQGNLQSHSPYIDLRRLPEAIYRQCEIEILQRIREPDVHADNAADHLRKKFGVTTAGYLIRVLEKLYHKPVIELDVSATYQPTMNRVILYGDDKMQEVLRDEAGRSTLAWPDQLTFPIKRQPRQCGLYPRRFGVSRVIEAMYRKLLGQGVTFFFNCQLVSWEIIHNSISVLKLNDNNKLENPTLVIAANGLHASCRLLCQEFTYIPALPSCWLVFLRVEAPPQMQRLYHFYCFDKGYTTFRVTNYYNYCPDAYDGAGYPLCIELWSNEENTDQAIQRAIKELRQMNVLTAGDHIISQAAMPAYNLHAQCTLDHVQYTRKMRMEVKQRSPQNMITIGSFAEDGVMLLYEVWKDMYRKLSDVI